MPTNKPSLKGKLPTELRVMERLALVEQFLAKLKVDFEAASFRRNRLVNDGIADGLDLVSEAVDMLAEESYEDADRICRVAWIRAHFARGVFDAEMTEHFLGEGIFLELDDGSAIDWRTFASEELAELQEEIVLLRKEIKERSAKRGKK